MATISVAPAKGPRKMTTHRTITAAAALGLAMILAGPASAQTEDIYFSASGSGTVGGVSYADAYPSSGPVPDHTHLL